MAWIPASRAARRCAASRAEIIREGLRRAQTANVSLRRGPSLFNIRYATSDVRYSPGVIRYASFGIRLARAHNAYAVIREVCVHLRDVNFGHVA